MKATYWRHTDDLALTAITVTASAEDPEYPAANLVSENPANPAKLTQTTGSWVLDFGSPVAPAAVLLAYHYLDPGIDVTLRGNATDSWGAPSFSQSITIPAKRLDGPSYQRWTVNALALLQGVGGGYRFWKLDVTGANSQNIVVGRCLLLSAPRTVELLDVSDGMGEGDDPGEIAHPTELGVETVYNPGGPRRSLSTFTVATDLTAGSAPVQDAADFRALHETSEGRLHPFVLVPFTTPGDPWLVRFESAPRQRTHKVGGYQVWPLEVRECSRGLPFP